jgi:hypothetical protein
MARSEDPPPLGLEDLGAADGPTMDTDGMGEPEPEETD